MNTYCDDSSCSSLAEADLTMKLHLSISTDCFLLVRILPIRVGLLNLNFTLVLKFQSTVFVDPCIHFTARPNLHSFPFLHKWQFYDTRFQAQFFK